MGGGQDKPAWTACPPGVKITRVGGKITRDSLPPRGASCPGGQDKLLHRHNFVISKRKKNVTTMNARVLWILYEKFYRKIHVCVYMSSICFKKKMEENLFNKTFLTQNLS